MNQTSDDPQVHAHLGLVRIPAGSCCEGQRWEEYTVDAATTLIVELSAAIREAAWQAANIKAACAQGHDWTDGWNHVMDGDKVTMRSCTREGCDERRIDPGWLPFEPKQHVVPFASKLLDCTGPGCDHCADEAFGDQLRKSFAAIGAVEFPVEPIAEGSEPLIVKKVGYEWHIDATPEQVQAALDARQGGG